MVEGKAATAGQPAASKLPAVSQPRPRVARLGGVQSLNSLSTQLCQLLRPEIGSGSGFFRCSFSTFPLFCRNGVAVAEARAASQTPLCDHDWPESNTSWEILGSSYPHSGTA